MLHLHTKQSRSYLRNERNALQRGQPLSTLNDSCVTSSGAEWECAGTKVLYWVRRLTPIAIPWGATLRQLCAPHMRPMYTIARGSALQSLAQKTARRRTKHEKPRFLSDAEHQDARCRHSHGPTGQWIVSSHRSQDYYLLLDPRRIYHQVSSKHVLRYNT